MRYLRLIGHFVRAALQEAMAYRANFFIKLLHSLLNLATGIVGLAILFGQVETVQGWGFAQTLALLGVYFTVDALRSLFIGPSLETLGGMEGEVWTGKFDFTLLRPVDTQFLASFRHWQPFALIDLLLGLGVLGGAVSLLSETLSVARLAAFFVALGAGVTILYSILLTFTALVFWSPGFLFTWVFDGLFQMARYPLGLYPGWLRLVLTWVVPVGVITTVPAQALSGALSPETLAGAVALAVAFSAGASALFRFGLRRYVSASS
jgi:ABC-2 type transport system permease protein